MELIELVKAFFFGVVEGVTEWLPISSTGMMMLFNQFFALNVSEAFYASFLVVIQLGAILAVIMLYFRQLNPFAKSKSHAEKRTTWETWLKVLIGTIPAGIVGVLLDDLVEENITNNPDIAYIVISIALIVYGVIFLVVERLPLIRVSRNQPKDRIDNISQLSYKHAVVIGLFQCLAIVPGTSRSGATILGAMFTGTSRSLATEFSFFLAIPIMFAWGFIKMVKHGLVFSGEEWLILGIGMVTAFCVSLVLVKFLVEFVKKHTFQVFGVFRIVLALLMLGYFGIIAGA